MSVHVIDLVDKNINMSVYIKNTQMYFFMFPSSSNIYSENIKNVDIWFTAKVFNIHKKYTDTDIFTALFSDYFKGEATGIQVPRGRGSEP